MKLLAPEGKDFTSHKLTLSKQPHKHFSCTVPSRPYQQENIWKPFERECIHEEKIRPCNFQWNWDFLQELTLPLSSLPSLPSCLPAKGHMASVISYSWTSFCFYLFHPLCKVRFVSGVVGYWWIQLPEFINLKICILPYYKNFKRQLLNHIIISWEKVKMSTFF